MVWAEPVPTVRVGMQLRGDGHPGFGPNRDGAGGGDRVVAAEVVRVPAATRGSGRRVMAKLSLSQRSPRWMGAN